MKIHAIALLLSASALASCGTIRKTATERVTIYTDTIIRVDTVRIDTVRVPADTVTLSVPVQMLEYVDAKGVSDRSGRATVRVQRINDTIYITAACDSLEKIILSKERELSRLRSSQHTATTTVEKKERNIWHMVAVGGFAIVLIILAVQFFIKLNPISWLKHVIQSLWKQQ